TGHAVIDLMFELNRANGATLVLVTHDIELAKRCDAIVTIEAGHRVIDGAQAAHAASRVEAGR
ncbi:hypothetical protein SB751_32100, partial [Cupriavidus sp. SIMBA_020]